MTKERHKRKIELKNMDENEVYELVFLLGVDTKTCSSGIGEGVLDPESIPEGPEVPEEPEEPTVPDAPENPTEVPGNSGASAQPLPPQVGPGATPGLG